jgi:hypothetical protein
MKVSYLAMTQTHAHFVFSIKTPVVLKPHVTQYLMRLMTPVEQYNLDVVDDEEAPCEAVQMMAIGEVKSQDPSETPSLNDITPPAQGLDQNEHKDKDEHQDQF